MGVAGLQVVDAVAVLRKFGADIVMEIAHVVSLLVGCCANLAAGLRLKDDLDQVHVATPAPPALPCRRPTAEAR
jgi:hypothetical protein